MPALVDVLLGALAITEGSTDLDGYIEAMKALIAVMFVAILGCALAAGTDYQSLGSSV